MEGGLESTGRSREVGRIGQAGHIGAAVPVQGDAIAKVKDAAAEVGAVDHPRARGI